MIGKLKGLISSKNYDVYTTSLFIIFVLVYFFSSFFSDGYYQHDEVGHLLNARGFWRNPYVIFSAWAKPGLKFVLIFPSLLGNQGILVVCCLITAGIGLYTNKLVHHLNIGNRYVAQIIASTLVLTLQLSFRAFSETFSAFFIILVLYTRNGLS